jgi:hypothetical protein
MLFFGLRKVPGAATAASGGCLLFDQYWPFAILIPKNRETETEMGRRSENGPVGDDDDLDSIQPTTRPRAD